MSGRLLSFSQYLGGADNVKVIEMFPSTQKDFVYDFGTDISAYTFEVDYQTIVVDTLTYDRLTGDPNFTESSVVGYFANVTEVANSFIDTSQAGSGQVTITIPSQRYTGKVTPDARSNVAITVMGVAWTDTSKSPATTDLHRWAIVERWEPDVPLGNPREEQSAQGGFQSLV